jgi:type II secretory pathway pseudopilin PulG
MSDSRLAPRGIINTEVLMTVAILIGLIGIVIVVLLGVTTREERVRNNNELAVVQSAIIIFMDQNETNTVIPRPKANANRIAPEDQDAPFKTYLRSLPTHCSYYWGIEGDVTQAQCP